MAGPWEQYQQAAPAPGPWAKYGDQQGPWSKYAQPEGPGLLQRAETAVADVTKKVIGATRPNFVPASVGAALGTDAGEAILGKADTQNRLRVSEPPQPPTDRPSPATVGADLKRFVTGARQQERESRQRIKSAVDAVGEPVTAGVSRADEAARKAYDDWLTAHPGDQKGAFNAMIEASRAAGGMSAAANIGISMGGGEPIKPPFKPPPLTELFTGKPKAEAPKPQAAAPTGEPPIPQGYIRLYRGETPGVRAHAPGQPTSGGWFTTNRTKAERYGDVRYLDVPYTKDSMKRFIQGHGGADEYVTDNPQLQASAKPLAAPPETAGEKIGRMAGLAAEREAGERGERVSGDPARSFESIAKDEVHAKQPTPEVGKPAPPSKPPVPPPGPVLDPPPGGEESIKGLQTRIEDAFNRLRKRATAAKVQARQFVEGLSPEQLDRDFQARAYSEGEQRMVDPKAKLSPEVEAFTQGPFKSWLTRQTAAANRVRQKLGKDANLADLPGYEEGYVRRVVGGKPAPPGALDPERGLPMNPIYGAGSTKTLSKRAASLQHRDFFVADDGNGNRQWLGPIGKGTKFPDYKPNQKVRLDNTPDSFTVRHATTAENEANTALRYHKNLMANTIDNTLRLERIEDNIDLLNELKQQLFDKDLWMPEGTQREIPDGWRPVTLPQLRGYANPRIANSLNDFHGLIGHTDLGEALAKLNHFIVGSLFATPIPHALNVFNHFIVGRGWDWIPGTGGWRRLMKASTRAAYDVWTQNARHQRLLKEGAGLIYSDVANENFHKFMIEKMGGEMLRDPKAFDPIMKALGITKVSDFVKWWYKTASKGLWLANDVFLETRINELEAKGYSVRDAIREAEKDIPNYRIPTEVMGSRPMHDLLVNPNITNFGRFRYGQFKAYATMIEDLRRGGKDPIGKSVRMDAAGKFAMLILFGSMYGLAAKALQDALGNQGIDVQRYGPFGPLHAALDMTFGQREYVKDLATILTPAPGIELLMEARYGKDPYTGKPLVDQNLPIDAQAVQLGEQAARQIYPLRLAEQMTKPGGVARTAAQQVGIKIPPPHRGPSPHTVIQQNKAAAARESQDTALQLYQRGRDWIERQFR